MLALPASAALTIDWVTVGNPGNANDTTGYGGVAYEYNIAKNETTIGQYAEFLNAVAKADTNALYNTKMGTDARGGITRSGSSPNYSYAVRTNMGNKPVNFVSWPDAVRFMNWLHNGKPTGAQGTGTTESGAYAISGSTALSAGGW